MRRFLSIFWPVLFCIALGLAGPVWPSNCPDDLLEFAQIKDKFGLGKAGADELLQVPLPTLTASFGRLSENETVELSVLYPESFGYFQHHFLKAVSAPLPDAVTANPKVSVPDTWSEWLLLESLQRSSQVPVRDYFGLSPIDLAGRPVALSEEQRQLRTQHWLDNESVPILWAPVFSHLAWLKQFGCSRENGVESWVTSPSCLGTLRSLYGALTEAWLLAPRENWIPGHAIRVGGKYHADGWRFSFSDGNFVLEGLTEIKPSIVRFHARGMYQIHGFLGRLLAPGNAVEIYGQKIDPTKLRIRTRQGLATLAQLRAQFGTQQFEKTGIELPNAEAPPIAYDGRWGSFVRKFEEFFDPSFYEAVLPKDEVPYVASHLIHLQNRPVGIQTPGLLTLAENRQRFIQFMAAFLNDPSSEALLSAAIFLKETHEHRDLLVHVALPGTAGISEPTPEALTNLDPRIKAGEYASILEEAFHRDVSYIPLQYLANSEKRKFLLEVLMPYSGWRTLLSSPGAFRPLSIDDTSLTIEPYGSMMPLRIEWVLPTVLVGPEWDTVGPVRTLRVPRGYRWPSDASVVEFFDYGLANHDLHRFTTPDWAERQRAGLGEPRVILKPGQKNILDRFRAERDANPDGRMEVYVQGPTAYGKTLILHEALKELIRRAPRSTSKRNLFFVVTGQKRLVEQISSELKRKRAHDLSEPVDFTHLSWETGNSRQLFKSLDEVVTQAEQEAEAGRAVVVTVNWSYLNQRTKEATPQAIEALRAKLGGFFIDEANQAGNDSNLATVLALADDVPGRVLWGQEAVGIHRAVIDEIFRGNIWWVVPTEDGTADPIRASLSQMTYSVRKGLIAPLAQHADNRVLLHFTPEQIVRNRPLPAGAQPRMIYRTITDAAHREALYGYLAMDLDQVLLRHRGLIRVENQQQALDLSQYLQTYFDQAREIDPTRPVRTIRPYFDGSPEHDSVYRRLTQTEGPDRVDWAVVVKQFDGGIDIPHLSGLVLVTEKIDPETLLEFLGRSMRLYPGKAPVEIVQISASPSLPESLIAGLQRKQETLANRTPSVPVTDGKTETPPPSLLERPLPEKVPKAPAALATAQWESRRRVAFFPVGKLPELSGSEDQIFIGRLVQLLIHVGKPKLDWVEAHPESRAQYREELRKRLAAVLELVPPHSALSEFFGGLVNRLDLEAIEREVSYAMGYLWFMPILDELELIHQPAQPPVEPRIFEQEYELSIYEGGEQRLLRYARSLHGTQFSVWPPSGEELSSRIRKLQEVWPVQWEGFPKDQPFEQLAFAIQELNLRSHQFSIELERWLSVKANWKPDAPTLHIWTVRLDQLLDCYRALLPNEPLMESAKRRVVSGSWELGDILLFTLYFQKDIRFRYPPLDLSPRAKTWVAKVLPLPSFEEKLNEHLQQLQSAAAPRPKNPLRPSEIAKIIRPWLDLLEEELPGREKLAVEAYQFLVKVKAAVKQAKDLSTPMDWSTHYDYVPVSASELEEKVLDLGKIVVVSPAQMAPLSATDLGSQLSWVVKTKALLDSRKYESLREEMERLALNPQEKRLFLGAWRMLELIRLQDAYTQITARFGAASGLAQGLREEIQYLTSLEGALAKANGITPFLESPTFLPLFALSPMTHFLHLTPSAQVVASQPAEPFDPDAAMERLLGYRRVSPEPVVPPPNLEAMVKTVGPRLSGTHESGYEVSYSPEFLLLLEKELKGDLPHSPWPLTEASASERVANLPSLPKGESGLEKFSEACVHLRFAASGAFLEADRAARIVEFHSQESAPLSILKQADLYLKEALQLAVSLFPGDEYLRLLKEAYVPSHLRQPNPSGSMKEKASSIKAVSNSLMMRLMAQYPGAEAHFTEAGSNYFTRQGNSLKSADYLSVQRQLEDGIAQLSKSIKARGDQGRLTKAQIEQILRPLTGLEGVELRLRLSENPQLALQFMQEVLQEYRFFAQSPLPLPLKEKVSFLRPKPAVLLGKDPLIVDDLPLALSSEEIGKLAGDERHRALVALIKRLKVVVGVEAQYGFARSTALGDQSLEFLHAWIREHFARLIDTTRGLEAILGRDCDLVRLLLNHTSQFNPQHFDTTTFTKNLISLQEDLVFYYPTILNGNVSRMAEYYVPLSIAPVSEADEVKRRFGYAPRPELQVRHLPLATERLLGGRLARPLDELITESFSVDLEERLKASSSKYRAKLRQNWLAKHAEPNADKLSELGRLVTHFKREAVRLSKLKEGTDRAAASQLQEKVFAPFDQARRLAQEIFPEDPRLSTGEQMATPDLQEMDRFLDYLTETYYLPLFQMTGVELKAYSKNVGESSLGSESKVLALGKEPLLAAIELAKLKSSVSPEIPFGQPTGVEAAKLALQVFLDFMKHREESPNTGDFYAFAFKMAKIHLYFMKPVWGENNAFSSPIALAIAAVPDVSDPASKPAPGIEDGISNAISIFWLRVRLLAGTAPGELSEADLALLFSSETKKLLAKKLDHFPEMAPKALSARGVESLRLLRVVALQNPNGLQGHKREAAITQLIAAAKELEAAFGYDPYFKAVQYGLEEFHVDETSHHQILSGIVEQLEDRVSRVHRLEVFTDLSDQPLWEKISEYADANPRKKTEDLIEELRGSQAGEALFAPEEAISVVRSLFGIDAPPPDNAVEVLERARAFLAHPFWQKYPPPTSAQIEAERSLQVFLGKLSEKLLDPGDLFEIQGSSDRVSLLERASETREQLARAFGEDCPILDSLDNFRVATADSVTTIGVELGIHYPWEQSPPKARLKELFKPNPLVSERFPISAEQASARLGAARALGLGQEDFAGAVLATVEEISFLQNKADRLLVQSQHNDKSFGPKVIQQLRVLNALLPEDFYFRSLLESKYARKEAELPLVVAIYLCRVTLKRLQFYPFFQSIQVGPLDRPLGGLSETAARIKIYQTLIQKFELFPHNPPEGLRAYLFPHGELTDLPLDAEAAYNQAKRELPFLERFMDPQSDLSYDELKASAKLELKKLVH